MDRTLFVAIVLSVFASLSVGVILGGELASDRRLVAEQDRLLSGLEREFEQLRQDAASLRRELAEVDQLRALDLVSEDTLAERLTQGMLADITVVVIGVGDSSTVDRATVALARAGAAVESVPAVTLSALTLMKERAGSEQAAARVLVASEVTNPGSDTTRITDADAVVVVSSSEASMTFLGALIEELELAGCETVLGWIDDTVPQDLSAEMAMVVGVRRGAGAAALCDAVLVASRRSGHND